GLRQVCTLRARRTILEELDRWALGRANGGDPELFDSAARVAPLGRVAHARGDDLEAERVAIERQALLGVVHDDPGVIDAEKDALARALPACGAPARGELRQLDRTARPA